MTNKRRRFCLCAITFFFWLSLYTYVPYFTPYLNTLGIAGAMIGLIAGSYGITQMLLRIPLGILSDLFKKQRIFILGGIVCAGLASVGMLFVTSAALMFCMRALTGVAASAWVIFTVLYNNSFEESEQRQAIGNINAVSSGAQLTAFVCTGLLVSACGVKISFIISIVSAVIAFCFGLTIKDVAVKQDPIRFADLVKVAGDRHVLSYSLLCAVAQFIPFATSQSFTSNYAKTIGAQDFELSFIMVVLMIGSVIGAAGISARLSGRIPFRVLSVSALIVQISYCILVPMSRSMAVLYLLQFISGIAMGALFSECMSGAIRFVKPEKRNTAMGLHQAIYSLGITFGPMIFGRIYESTAAFAPAYWATAGVAVLGIFIALFFVPKETANEAEAMAAEK